jgi:uncharacterized sulfatase
MFEGGLRVPYVAKWPGHIAPGTQYQQPISNIDIMPTVVAAAGAKMTTDRPIDGVNLLPFLTKKPAIQAPRPLFWRDGTYRAMQENKWKLIVSERPKKDWLFNLADDPTERINLAIDNPQMLSKMKAKMEAHHAQMPPSQWPSFLEMAIEIDKTLDQKHLPTDEYTYWNN